jgi:hypothetical protein
MPYLNSYTYTIYQDGGAVKARNNKTGAVTSNANLDPLITTILASGDPNVEIQTGTYNLHSSFAGWNMVTDAVIFMHRGCKLWVPNGYTGDVFKFSPSGAAIFGAKVVGGEINETATAANDWTCFAFKPTNGDGVVKCEIKDTQVWRCKHVFHFSTTALSWGSDNRFINIEGEACEDFAKFDHTSTWTADASGFHGNTFQDCFLQATSAAGGNPQVQGGILNVMGDGNIFINCNMWDMSNNASAPSMSIHANARGTQIIGGLLTHQQFTDAGTLTKRSNRLHKGVATYYDNLTIIDPTNNFSNGLITLKKDNPSVTDFLDWGINFEGKSDTGVSKVWSRFITATDDDTEGSEDTWFGVEYRMGGTLAPRGLFYNNGIGMGPSGTRAYINNSGLTGNRTFTLPDRAGQIAVSGGMVKTGYQSVSTTPVTLSATTDQLVKVDATGGARTVNLPAASGNSGLFYTIIKSDSSANAVTIDGNSSETINGATTFVLTAQYQSVVIWCDGSNWLTQPNTSERTGEATGTANGSTTVFNIAHGIGTTPSTVFVECSTHTGTFTRTKDSTNIVVTFGTAPSASPSTIKFDWRAIA